MDIVEMLLRAQGGGALENVGNQVGLDATQTRAAIEQLAPVIAAGVQRNAQGEQGLGDLLAALQRGNHGRYMEDAASLGDARDDGNGILGHIFGDKDVSRAVAAHASEQTGIGSTILKQLLPIIASMVMGSLSNRTREPGLQDILGQVLGGALGGSQTGGSSSGGGGLLESVLGGILGGGSDSGGGRSSRDSSASASQPGLQDIFGDLLGGGSSSSGSSGSSRGSSRSSGGSAAEDLLESVLRNARR
jgi:hypothetical protein